MSEEKKYFTQDEMYGGAEHPDFNENAEKEVIETENDRKQPTLEELMEQDWGDEDEDIPGDDVSKDDNDKSKSGTGDGDEDKKGDDKDKDDVPLVKKSSDEWAELINESKKTKVTGMQGQDQLMFNALVAAGRVDEAQALHNKMNGIQLPPEKEEETEYEMPQNLEGFNDHPVIKQMEEFMKNQRVNEQKRNEQDTYNKAIENVTTMVTGNDEYELIEQYNGYNSVVQTMLSFHKQTGRPLGFEQACKLVEKRFEEELFEKADILKKTKKYGKKYGEQNKSEKKNTGEKRIEVKNGVTGSPGTKLDANKGRQELPSIDELIDEMG